MKVLVLVALFAFVAVQVAQSAPVPEDAKVENVEKTEDKKEEPASPAAVAADEPAPVVVAESKSESVSSDAPKPAEAAPADEKKE